MKTARQIQTRLAALGLYGGSIDGDLGKLSKAAIETFQKVHGLKPDGIVGPITERVMFPVAAVAEPLPTTEFDKASYARLLQMHPLLQRLFVACRRQAVFMILESQRGRKEQEKAFKAGHSKVHYGNSAHNWTPAIAADVAPLPLDWSKPKPFINLQMEVIKPTAAKLNIPIRQGCDWNRNGILTDESFVDLPHVELHPWREFAKSSRPFEP